MDSLACSFLVLGLFIALMLSKLREQTACKRKEKPILPIASPFDPISFLKLKDPEVTVPVENAQNFDLKHAGFIHTRSRKIIKA
jgi:hypothetical protein